jgi:small redox-active disulfide protein 2
VKSIYIDILRYVNEVTQMVKTIKVFGGEPPCAKCKAVEKTFNEAVKEMGLDAQVVHVSAMSEEADKYDILSTPAVVINDRLILSGKLPSKEEVKRILEKEVK